MGRDQSRRLKRELPPVEEMLREVKTRVDAATDEDNDVSRGSRLWAVAVVIYAALRWYHGWIVQGDQEASEEEQLRERHAASERSALVCTVCRLPMKDNERVMWLSDGPRHAEHGHE